MIKKVAFLLFAGTVISVIVSCVPHFCYIYDIRFSTHNSKTTYGNVTDTLKNELSFEILGKTKYYTAQNNISLINRANATQIFYRLENYILVDEMELRFDSNIYFDDNVIEANTNLLNNEFLQDYKWISPHNNELGESIGGWVYILFGFDESVFEYLVIPTKWYSIELTCRTNDGQEFVEKIDVYIDNE